MLSWFAWAVGAFLLSIVSAGLFLRLLCQGTGRPFGRRARPWAVTIIMITAVVSTGLGLALAAVSHRIEVVVISLVIPSGLWLSKLLPQRDLVRPLGTLATWLQLPFRRLYDRMGDDMQDWCDARLRAASTRPQWIADAVTYYYDQVQGRIKDHRALATLGSWRESITHKISIVRLISLDTTPTRLRASLQMHPSTQNDRKYADDDLPLLARRLESEALNELTLFLAYVYQLGYTRLPVYPFRPPVMIRAGQGTGDAAKRARLPAGSHPGPA
jgi:hypothetical protein